MSQVAAWFSEAHALAPGLVTTVERTGAPASEIVKYAADADCDIIVVGSHARRGIQRLVLGSVAAVRDAGRPVLVVPVRADASERVLVESEVQVGDAAGLA